MYSDTKFILVCIVGYNIDHYNVYEMVVVSALLDQLKTPAVPTLTDPVSSRRLEWTQNLVN